MNTEDAEAILNGLDIEEMVLVPDHTFYPRGFLIIIRNKNFCGQKYFISIESWARWKERKNGEQWIEKEGPKFSVGYSKHMVKRLAHTMKHLSEVRIYRPSKIGDLP